MNLTFLLQGQSSAFFSKLYTTLYAPSENAFWFSYKISTVVHDVMHAIRHASMKTASPITSTFEVVQSGNISSF